MREFFLGLLYYIDQALVRPLRRQLCGQSNWLIDEGNFAPDTLFLYTDMSILDRSNGFHSLKSCFCGSQGPEALSVPEQSL